MSNGKIMCNHGVNLFKCQTCIDALVAVQIEKQEQRISELVARVARLEQAINNVDDRSYEDWLLHLNTVFSETESESLAYIQADAIEKAAEELRPFAFYMHGRGNMICEHSLRNYAKQLRQQQTNRSDGNDD